MCAALSAVHFGPADALAVLHRHPPIALLDVDDPDNRNHGDDEKNQQSRNLARLQHIPDSLWDCRDNTAEDDDRDAAADALFRNQFAEPDGKDRSGGKRDDDRDRLKRISCQAKFRQDGRIALRQDDGLRKSLQGRERNREQVRNLVDALPAGVAALAL